MKSAYRRGLAFVLTSGSWADTSAEAPTSLVLNAVKAQKNRRNAVTLKQGPTEANFGHILVVWTSQAAMKRLHSQVREGTLGHPSMTIVRLNPRAEFKGVQLTDFRTAARRAAAGTCSVLPIPARAAKQTAAEENPPANPPSDVAPASESTPPPAVPAVTTAEAPPAATAESAPNNAPNSTDTSSAVAETPVPAAAAPTERLPGQAEVLELKDAQKSETSPAAVAEPESAGVPTSREPALAGTG